MTDWRGTLTLTVVRAERWATVVSCALLLAGCSSASSAAHAPGTTAGSSPSTTTRSTNPPPPPTTAATRATTSTSSVTTTEPGSPTTATFVETDARNNRVAIARVSDGSVVKTLQAPLSPPVTLSTIAMRAPNGDLLTFVSPQHRADPGWTDTTTGLRFPGYPARVSPDGTRIATVVDDARRRRVIRQYDFKTARVLSNLVAVSTPNNYAGLGGFDWTPDGRAFVVAITPNGAGESGLYVVDRDAQEMPKHATVTNPGPYAYASPAVLDNGHVVAFDYQFPDQHNGWGAALVDIDLTTGAKRTLLGTTRIFSPDPVTLCVKLPRSTPATSPQYQSCFLHFADFIDAKGNDALMTDGDSTTWLYDGDGVRRIASGNYAAFW